MAVLVGICFSITVCFLFMLLGPSVMYLFLRYISGVPFAEMSSLERRGTDYLQYQRRPVFFSHLNLNYNYE